MSDMGKASAVRLHWPVELLREQLAPLLPGVVVEVAAQIDSTNSELMRRARAGRLAPTLLVAESQTAGRGRLGRHWDSQPGAVGAALSFSLGLPMAPADWSGLSLAVGLAAAEALHPDVRIKWPNDLWVGGRKLAGILVETAGAGAPDAPRAVVVGIGLNVLPQAGAEPGGADGRGALFATSPAWLQALRPDLDAPAALLAVARPLVQALRRFEREGFAPLVERYAARDALAGPVRLSDGTEGVSLGVGAGGELRVQTADGVREVRTAEVSVRPLASAPPRERAP